MTAPHEKRIFLLDTNILINFSVWMPITLNRVFWQKLEEALQSGAWILLDVVVGEVKYDEDLKKWCSGQVKKGLVKSISDENRNRAVEINNTYKMIDETTQKSTVDTYLIAYAEEHKLVVFSRESQRFNNTDLYKIPDVCDLLKIKNIKKPKAFLEDIGFKN